MLGFVRFDRVPVDVPSFGDCGVLDDTGVDIGLRDGVFSRPARLLAGGKLGPVELYVAYPVEGVVDRYPLEGRVAVVLDLETELDLRPRLDVVAGDALRASLDDDYRRLPLVKYTRLKSCASGC